MGFDESFNNCVVINFDYPGVGDSTGKSTKSKHLVDAGMAQVQRLLDMGVPAENILLKGQSIGGGVATLTAAKFHQEGHRVHLYNQRSFSKLSTAAKQMLGGGRLGSIAASIIKATGWEIDSLKAWKKIPDAYKDFCFAVNDTVIPADKAGLAGALGKFDDKDRRLETAISYPKGKPPTPIKVGHNTNVYGSELSPTSQTVKNANGMLAIEMFDNVVKKALFTNHVEINLDDSQKIQVEHLIHSLNRKPSSPTSKLSFNTNQVMLEKVFGKNGSQVMKLLESIKQEGKITDKQLSVLENYCERAQKKVAKDPSVGSFLVNANELIKAIKIQQDPSLRRSQSVRQ
ncbi:hypothetical protein [Candidatus Berkiella aquae]|uniref:Alpha/beta hydrolase family protein n=1 Tax=Candidatus Berkiella aquae TaxID=295108 RepID=A0A0Q9YYW8_9GAMM|nr:hypothetical protein [Candidatus Berkiella aquae]MCS5710403.1 hypothetical protein [Candidatus Berkiella aquae]